MREYARAKYACPRCEEGGVVSAPAPARFLPKSQFGPELLAQLLVSKYDDHLPLHRQIKIFQRHGVALRESSVNDAVLGAAERLAPLVTRLKAHVLKGQRIFTDVMHTLPTTDPTDYDALLPFHFTQRFPL